MEKHNIFADGVDHKFDIYASDDTLVIWNRELGTHLAARFYFFAARMAANDR